MRVFRRSSRTVASRAVALLCAGALLAGSPALGTNAEETRKARRLSEVQRILHVLNRLGFGARPGDVERVRAMGLERYVEQQLHPEKIDDAAAEAKVKNLTALQLSTAELFAKYPRPGALLRRLERGGEVPPELAPVVEARKKAQAAAEEEKKGAKPEGAETDTRPRGQEARRALRAYLLKNGMRPPQQLTAELQASRILRAVYSERQLQEALVDFWTNHFNVFAGKGADRWLLISYDRDTIRPHTLGKFYDLLQATAESPAMLFYLDNFQSVSPNAGAGRRNRRGGLVGLMTGQEGEAARPQQPQRRRRGVNENYARELMELHTLGVDGGYTQKDVQEVARCFTGWTIRAPRGYRNAAEGVVDDHAGQFHFNPRLHDDGEKIVLGHKIPAGGGVRDGLMVLEILARHPSTAKFIATKLARRFVSDDPSPALVNRAAATFTRTGGDIRETLRALLASPEFNSAESYRAKIKTPFELAVSSLRALGGETNGGPGLHQWIARMGEPLYLYQAPTGYPDAAANWVNTGALLERLNFGLALASNRIPGTRVDLARFAGGAQVSAANLERVTDRFLEVLVHGDVSPKTKATLLRQLNEPLPAAAPQTQAVGAADDDEMLAAGRRRRQAARAAAADFNSAGDPELVKVVGLILGSPEFQRQ